MLTYSCKMYKTQWDLAAAAEKVYGINKTENKIFIIGYDTNLKIVETKTASEN